MGGAEKGARDGGRRAVGDLERVWGREGSSGVGCGIGVCVAPTVGPLSPSPLPLPLNAPPPTPPTARSAWQTASPPPARRPALPPSGCRWARPPRPPPGPAGRPPWRGAWCKGWGEAALGKRQKNKTGVRVVFDAFFFFVLHRAAPLPPGKHTHSYRSIEKNQAGQRAKTQQQNGSTLFLFPLFLTVAAHPPPPQTPTAADKTGTAGRRPAPPTTW